MTIKEQLHELVERLTNEQTEEVLNYVMQCIDGAAADPASTSNALPHPRLGGVLISGADFNRMPKTDLATLIAQQGVKPVKDFESLLGDFWPDNEDEDFDEVLRQWRSEV